MPSRQWLLKRADYYQQIADEYLKKAEGLRFAAEEANGHQRIEKQAESGSAIEQARALRQVQRVIHRVKKGKGKGKLAKGDFRDAALYVLHQAKSPLSTTELRERMEDRLARKLGHSSAGFGSLVRYGYAKLTSEGYVGTGKTAPDAGE